MRLCSCPMSLEILVTSGVFVFGDSFLGRGFLLCGLLLGLFLARCRFGLCRLCSLFFGRLSFLYRRFDGCFGWCFGLSFLLRWRRLRGFGGWLSLNGFFRLGSLHGRFLAGSLLRDPGCIRAR